MIAIVDYGMGNLRSVQKALEYLGAPAQITHDPHTLRAADAIVLPGVGAFGAAMERLNAQGLTDALRREMERGKPFLGICLGLQLLYESSEESPGVEGLGVLKGRVVGFKSRPDFPLPVPHIGWSALHLTQPESPLWEGVSEGNYVYFVHSYYPEPEETESVLATCDYGGAFACAVGKDNLYAVQFHPEKSGAIGLQILRNFLATLGVATR